MWINRTKKKEKHDGPAKIHSPGKHDYYKKLRTKRNDETSHGAEDEDIVYTADELITHNILQQNFIFMKNLK